MTDKAPEGFDKLLKAMVQGEPPKSKATAKLAPIRVHLGPMPEMEKPKPKKP